MFERISDAIQLFCLRAVEWVAELSPIGKTTLFAAFLAALLLAAHFGLIPNRWGQRECFYCK